MRKESNTSGYMLRSENYSDYNYSIAFVGYGHVNKSIAELFDKRFTWTVYDKYQSIHNYKGTKDNCNECKFAFVAVPTDAKKDGSCDLSNIEESIKWLNTEIIIIKSTVPPGTTEKLKDKYPDKRIVMSPEFYGESKYYIPSEMNDVWEWPYHIFGGDKKDTTECIDLFMEVLGPTKKYYQTDATTAEFVKYAENTFFAMKVAYCQELFDLCEKIGVDYNEMREMWVADPRINEMHTSVFRHKRGYGGKCFPKDVSALVHLAKEYKVDLSILNQVIKSNEKIRKTKEAK